MRGFVRLGGTGHRSGGVPGAIAPQVSVSGWARPRTPGQVERGFERLAWLGCGWQPGQGVRVRGPLAGHARVAALARDRGPGHGPPHFRRFHTPGRSRTAPAARRGPPGPAGCLVRSRPTTAVLQAPGRLISEGPVLRRAFTVGAGPLPGPTVGAMPFDSRTSATPPACSAPAAATGDGPAGGRGWDSEGANL